MILYTLFPDENEDEIDKIFKQCTGNVEKAKKILEERAPNETGSTMRGNFATYPISKICNSVRYLASEPWRSLFGAVALAILNTITVLTTTHPWGVSSSIALWGTKLLKSIGVSSVAQWAYWARPDFSKALQNDILEDKTTLTNIGIVLGVATVTIISSKFANQKAFPWKSIVAAIVGGFLLGYGCRLAFGCNVGAYFSGLCSFSLSGWLWLFSSLPGSYIGIKIRPWFEVGSEEKQKSIQYEILQLQDDIETVPEGDSNEL